MEGKGGIPAGNRSRCSWCINMGGGRPLNPLPPPHLPSPLGLFSCRKILGIGTVAPLKISLKSSCTTFIFHSNNDMRFISINVSETRNKSLIFFCEKYETMSVAKISEAAEKFSNIKQK